MEEEWWKTSAAAAKKKMELAWSYSEKQWWEHCQADATVDTASWKEEKEVKVKVTVDMYNTLFWSHL